MIVRRPPLVETGAICNGPSVTIDAFVYENVPPIVP